MFALFQSVLQQASKMMSRGEDHLLNTIQVNIEKQILGLTLENKVRKKSLNVRAKALKVKNWKLHTLQRHNTKISKQIFPEKELLGLSPYFYIHVSVSDLYIPKIGLPILLQENMWTNLGNI